MPRTAKAATCGRPAVAVSTDTPRFTCSVRARAGYVFENEIVGGAIPKEFIKPIDEGIKEALTRGVLAGLPGRRRQDRAVRRLVPRRRFIGDGVQDRRVAGIPGRGEEGEAVLLEPVMRVEVVVPKDYLGDVMGDLASRRGRIQSQEDRGGTQIIKARVPLSEMFGYATDLRSRTQGRATYSMHFDRYEQAPQNVSEEVVARIQGTK